MNDVREIKAVAARQFSALSWSAGNAGNWQAFAAEFLDGAALYPAARPVKPQSVQA